MSDSDPVNISYKVINRWFTSLYGTAKFPWARYTTHPLLLICYETTPSLPAVNYLIKPLRLPCEITFLLLHSNQYNGWVRRQDVWNEQHRKEHRPCFDERGAEVTNVRQVSKSRSCCQVSSQSIIILNKLGKSRSQDYELWLNEISFCGANLKLCTIDNNDCEVT